MLGTLKWSELKGLRSVRNTQAIKFKPFRSVRKTEVVTVKNHLGVLDTLKLLKLSELRSIGNTPVVISFTVVN